MTLDFILLCLGLTRLGLLAFVGVIPVAVGVFFDNHFRGGEGLVYLLPAGLMLLWCYCKVTLTLLIPGRNLPRRSAYARWTQEFKLLLVGLDRWLLRFLHILVTANVALPG